MSRVDLRQLRDLLSRLADEQDAQEHYLGLLPPRRRIQRLMDRSVASLMDRYDIREIVAGRDWPRHDADGIGLKVPRAETNWFSLYSSYSLYATYGTVQRGMAAGLTGVQVPAETEEERAERERARKALEDSRINGYNAKLSRVGAMPAALLEEPKSSAAGRIPDYTHTLVAWRAWLVRSRRLDSLGVDNLWQPRVALPANCVKMDDVNHHSPSMDCTCGYWSFKTLDVLGEAIRHDENMAVIGKVAIWGRVIECEQGYRSEYAYPQELWLLKPGLEYLSWTYGVPVRKV